MTAAGGSCPSDESLEAVAAGTPVAADVREHLAACASCAGRLEQMRRDNDLLAEVVAAHTGRANTGRTNTGRTNTGRTNTESPTPPIGPTAGLPGAPDATPAPEGYEILDEIHRGGQGVVYRARQTATKRIVALKVMLHGTFATTPQRRRFEREVELVASLRHPNIVTVYDSGVAPDGRHYLAMEHIEGRQLGAAATPASVAHTIDVFVKICDAVQCAHRRGIIHRDLKPANILVDDTGEPHVLDFGVAKDLESETPAEDAHTRIGEFIGTFGYAAPEQVAADPALVDTRTDVYALGVILYELLTGRRPYELTGSLRQVIETITETEPPPPSRHRDGLDRDLDTIVLTALAKDPGQRYQSADSLREDLVRYRRGAPIAARQHDAWYVFRKTVRRYRAPIAIVAVLLVMLAGFTATTAWLYVGQTRANDKMAKSVGASLELFGAIDLENPQSAVQVATIPAILANASRIAREDLADVPDIAAPVLSALGLAYLSLSDFDAAERHLSDALATSRRVHGDVHAEVAAGLHNLARFYWKIGAFERAEDMYDRALTMRRTLFGDRDPRVARTAQHLASTIQSRGRLAEAERLHRDALEMRRELLGPDHPDVAISLNALGSCLQDQGRLDEALASYRAALDIVGRTAADEPDWQVARAMHSVATALIDLGDLDEAESLLTRSIAINRQTRGEDDPEIARGIHEVARLRLARGDASAAAPLANRALEIRAAAFPDAHPTRIESLALVGRIELAKGAHAEAEARFRQALAMSRTTYGDDHWRTAELEHLLGEAISRRPEAEGR